MVEVEFYLNVPAQAHVCFLAFPPQILYCNLFICLTLYFSPVCWHLTRGPTETSE